MILNFSFSENNELKIGTFIVVSCKIILLIPSLNFTKHVHMILDELK